MGLSLFSIFITYLFPSYLEKSHTTGESLCDQAREMKSNDLIIMCELLFKRENIDSHGDGRSRCLLVLQWQLFGRINEIAMMKLNDFTVFEDERHRCLEVFKQPILFV